MKHLFESNYNYTNGYVSHDYKSNESYEYWVGEFSNLSEYLKLINIDLDNYNKNNGGYHLAFLYPDICKEFNLPTPKLDCDCWADMSDEEIIKDLKKYVDMGY